MIRPVGKWDHLRGVGWLSTWESVNWSRGGELNCYLRVAFYAIRIMPEAESWN